MNNEITNDIAVQLSFYRAIVNMIFNGAELSYDDKSLTIGNSHDIMALIRVIFPDRYDEIYNNLKLNKREY